MAVEQVTETVPLWKKAGGVVMIGLAAVLLVYFNYPAKTYSQSLSYFSDDDGKTWFVDNVDLLPPFSHNGREAVRAVIYSHAGGSKQFCGYLIKFSDESKRKIEKLASQKSAEGKPQTNHSVAYESENNAMAMVKRPLKSEEWFSINSTKGNEVMRVRSPDGSELDSVMP